MEIAISPEAFELVYIEGTHYNGADRQLTAPAKVHRPVVFMHTQKAPALPASSRWKRIPWELSTFWETALFTWTWSLGVKERVQNNNLQSWSMWT